MTFAGTTDPIVRPTTAGAEVFMISAQVPTGLTTISPTPVTFDLRPEPIWMGAECTAAGVVAIGMDVGNDILCLRVSLATWANRLIITCTRAPQGECVMRVMAVGLIVFLLALGWPLVEPVEPPIAAPPDTTEAVLW